MPPPGGGGGCTPLYKPYRLKVFAAKKGMVLQPFWSEIGYR